MNWACGDCDHEVWRCESCWIDLVWSREKSVLTSWITYSAGFMYMGICSGSVFTLSSTFVKTTYVIS